jgi:hypothetical protein
VIQLPWRTAGRAPLGLSGCARQLHGLKSMRGGRWVSGTVGAMPRMPCQLPHQPKLPHIRKAVSCLCLDFWRARSSRFQKCRSGTNGCVGAAGCRQTGSAPSASAALARMYCDWIMSSVPCKVPWLQHPRCPNSLGMRAACSRLSISCRGRRLWHWNRPSV